jgi:hypothetical protein
VPASSYRGVLAEIRPYKHRNLSHAVFHTNYNNIAGIVVICARILSHNKAGIALIIICEKTKRGQ